MTNAVVTRPVGRTRGHEGQGPRVVTAFTLRVGDLRATIWDYGATLVSMLMPDHAGELADIVRPRSPLGIHDNHDDRGGYPGATVGRCANRIANGRFRLDGDLYELDRNEGEHHLHGGRIGFDQYVWDARPISGDAESAVTFSHHSPHGDQGYPGSLDAQVSYRLDARSLTIDYRATTDAPTVVNLTNHTYWNLSGRPSMDGHTLRIAASRHVTVDQLLIPTGALESVSGTRFDFNEARTLDDLEAQHGYDDCFVLADDPGPAATLRHLTSNRTMTLHTDQAGLQLYTGNHLQPRFSAICLETQALPNAANEPGFGSIVLRPGEVYRHEATHVFSWS